MKKNSEITTVSKNVELDDQLKKAIKTIDKKLADLGVSMDYKFKSSPNFKYNENDANNINIQACIDVVYLLKALAKMKRVKAEYNDLCKEIGVNIYPIATWLGYSIDGWIDDLTFRVKVVSNTTIINQLNQSKAELNQFLSQDDRLKNTLDKISKILK